MISDFQGLRTEYKKIELALYFIELIDKVSHPEMLDSENIFHLLGNSLKILESNSNLQILKLHFEIKFLHYMGLLESMPECIPYLKTPFKESHTLSFNKDLSEKIQFLLAQV